MGLVFPPLCPPAAEALAAGRIETLVRTSGGTPGFVDGAAPRFSALQAIVELPDQSVLVTEARNHSIRCCLCQKKC